MKVSIASEISGVFQATVKRCAGISGVCLSELSPKSAEWESRLRETDVLVTEPAVVAENMDKLTQVKWVQSTYAGVDPLMHLPPPSFLFTRLKGPFSQLMAEYVIQQIVNRERGMAELYEDQKKRQWNKRQALRGDIRHLSSLTIGILGVGDIGKRIAEVCKVFGMTVWGVTRTPATGEKRSPHVDHYRLLDGLPELLSNSDYVCNILPSTPLTRGLLNGGTLRHCSTKKSVLINIGRGDIVSEATIISAIRQGWLGGAILDVFETEPLPEDSELWGMPEVVITPHCSGLTTPREFAELFATNLQLFLAGKELKNTVDWTRGY